MKPNDDPFVPWTSVTMGGAGVDARRSAAVCDAPAPIPTSTTARQAATLTPTSGPAAFGAPAVGRLHGFDLLDRPIVSALRAASGLLLPARATVPLRREHGGHEVLVVFEDGEIDKPVIVGVIDAHPLQDQPLPPAAAPTVVADGERRLIEAGREIVLKCGEASITLTRAGKVIIRGSYILSRATGYNKIKGAAVELN